MTFEKNYIILNFTFRDYLPFLFLVRFFFSSQKAETTVSPDVVESQALENIVARCRVARSCDKVSTYAQLVLRGLLSRKKCI